MCESYIMLNDGNIKSTTVAIELLEKVYNMGFFVENLKEDLEIAIKLRDRYTNDYYIREDSEKLIEEFCFNRLAYLNIFLEESKDKVILKYKDK